MSTPRGSLVTAEAQRSILRGLDSRQFNTVESKKFQKGDFAKRERDTVEIRIPGLKDSKAAQNPDGGVKDLLAFIERKASGLAGSPRGGIRIKKV
jgi:nuclear RNA export factor